MKRYKNVVRTSFLLALMAVLSVSLGTPPRAVAQVNQVYGTFGNRTLGQPLGPPHTAYAGGFQTYSTGAYLAPGRSAGAALFATPWRPINPIAMQPAVVATPVAQPASNPAASPQAPTPQYNVPELQSAADLAASSFPETGGGEGMGPAEQGLGTIPGFGQSAAWNYAVPQGGAQAAAAQRSQPYIRSPELSERLTRIARSKGILSGPSIDVYFSNDVTLVKGTVRSPGDGILLAHVLALEPGVRQIDNRLIAEGSGPLSPESQSR